MKPEIIFFIHHSISLFFFTWEISFYTLVKVRSERICRYKAIIIFLTKIVILIVSSCSKTYSKRLSRRIIADFTKAGGLRRIVHDEIIVFCIGDFNWCNRDVRSFQRSRLLFNGAFNRIRRLIRNGIHCI